MAIDLNKQFVKKDIKVANKISKALHLVFIRECKLKPQCNTIYCSSIIVAGKDKILLLVTQLYKSL